MKVVNNRVRGTAVSEASSDGAKFRCGVAALLALELAIKILREVEAAVLPVF